MLLGGAIGVVLSYLIAAAVGTLPLMGPLFEDDSGRGDIHLQISLVTVTISTHGAVAGRRAQRIGSRDESFEARSGGSAALRIILLDQYSSSQYLPLQLVSLHQT